ncbi:Uncharacterized membrane protein [Streptococcus gallolyticus]|uniref:Uncharacterized membrane protein n=1 Tax=Streptococcus gallolyticus TaxID=315405 RepID=A0A1H9UM49_9STRE|nr:DUF975 family protein [Streptococcus gallolyticus]MCY7171210.1 DUF975 family protein [Streptococcus gallolyticus subsp. gallolyticus]SEF23327.1 Uncharacterized membrane protein [Streptococcus gallolyticus]SEM32683.1 Uncharacterized membrane protein [Streptococcus gallolyticus]SES10432.1 Uncharacterized membrane protein [Streptococcus gallolyticus]
MKASETRQKAREFLKTLSGKYQLFIVSIVLAILTISVTYRETIFTTSDGTEFSITESVPTIIGILSALFLASASYAVLDVIRHKRDHVEVGDNMIVFSNELFGKYVLTAILKWIFIFLWSLIAGVGIFIFAIGAAYAAVDDSAAGWVIVIIGLITMIAGFVLAIIKNYSYAMTTYILYDDVQNDTYEGPRSVIRKSKELMNGNKWRFFCLQFSFIGWYILTGITCGLLYFYTLPYMTTADLFFYENLLENAE